MENNFWAQLKSEFSPRSFYWGWFAAVVSILYGVIYAVLLVLDAFSFAPFSPREDAYGLPLFMPSVLAMPWAVLTFQLAEFARPEGGYYVYATATAIAGALMMLTLWMLLRGFRRNPPGTATPSA